MFRVLSNQQYQHLTNQKLRLWANAVFQNRGVCLPAKSRRTSGRRVSSSLFRRDRSDDRIYVCCSQARSLRASVSFFPLPLPHHSFFLFSFQLFSTNSRGNTWRPVGNAATTDYGAFHKRMIPKKVTGNGNMELLACSM